MSGGASSQKDLEDRARNAGAFAAIFALLAGGGFAGVLPKAVAVVAGSLAAVGLIAAWLFYVEARKAGQKVAEREEERELAELDRRAPVFELGRVDDPTRLGVDRAAQDILPGGGVPEYVPRSIDEELRAAIAAAFDGSGAWLVVVEGPSKVGKSRALFEALIWCASGRRVDLVAPRDAAAMDKLSTPGDTPDRATSEVLWLDDLEPYLNDGVTLAMLREWRDRGSGRIVVATYGGKGSEKIAGTVASGLTTIATEVLQSAREISMTTTSAGELDALRSRVSVEQFESLTRHGLAARRTTTRAQALHPASHSGRGALPRGCRPCGRGGRLGPVRSNRPNRRGRAPTVVAELPDARAAGNR